MFEFLSDKLLTLDLPKRVDGDAGLNRDFLSALTMCDLSMMLGQHGQSMFEFLASPRRPGRVGQPHFTIPPSNPHPLTDNSYQDRVF